MKRVDEHAAVRRHARWARRVLPTGLMAFLLLAWVGRSQADLADVHLRNGLVLRGEVSATDEEVVIRNVAGEVRLPRSLVSQIVPVPAASTQPIEQPATSATSPSETEPMESAPEVLEEPAPGTTELPPAPPLSDDDIQRLRRAELRLDGAAERVRVRFLRKGRQRDLALEVLEQLRRRRDYQPQWEQILLHGQPHEKLQLILRTTRDEHAERIVIESDPLVFDTFRRRVLPVVTRGCVRSGCHAGRAARVFRFPLGSPGSDVYAYTTFVLLDQMETRHGPLLNRSNPEDSVLLSYLLPPEATSRAHPPVGRGPSFKAVVRDREERPYLAVLSWIDMLAVPRPDYGLKYVNPYAGRLTAPTSVPSTEPAQAADSGVEPAVRVETMGGTSP